MLKYHTHIHTYTPLLCFMQSCSILTLPYPTLRPYYFMMLHLVSLFLLDNLPCYRYPTTTHTNLVYSTSSYLIIPIKQPALILSITSYPTSFYLLRLTLIYFNMLDLTLLLLSNSLLFSAHSAIPLSHRSEGENV